MGLLSEAIDKKASIRIHFSQFKSVGNPVYQEEAHDLILQFAEALGTEKIQHNSGMQYADDYTIDVDDYRVCCSYKPSDPDRTKAKRHRIEQLRKELVELENDEEVTA